MTPFTNQLWIPWCFREGPVTGYGMQLREPKILFFALLVVCCLIALVAVIACALLEWVAPTRASRQWLRNVREWLW